jgi:hypothetical protein
MRSLRAILGLLVLAGAIILPHRWEASRECRAFTGVVNRHMERLDQVAVPMNEQNLAESIRLMADECDALGEELSGMEFRTGKVMGFHYEYRSFARDASSVLRALARAVESGNPTELRIREDAFDRLIAEEEALATRVSEVCGAH